MIHNTQSAQISQKQGRCNIYAIMKTMCPPSYRYNGFVGTHALGQMMYGYTLLVPMNQKVLNKLSKEHIISDPWHTECSTQKAHCFHDCILHLLCFCEIWALCVLWITYDHLIYAPCIACRALFGSLVPAMCNCTSTEWVATKPLWW